MDSSDPLHWLIFLLTVLIAVLALRDPWDKDAWGDSRKPPPEDERREPRR
jgi:hypothetical protein